MERAWVPKRVPLLLSLSPLEMYRELSCVESLPESPVSILGSDLWGLWKSWKSDQAVNFGSATS